MAVRVHETQPALLDEQTLRMPQREVVSQLVDTLGSRLVAVIGNVKQTRTVREWMENREPQGHRLQVLRFALQVARAIKTRYDDVTAQSWFQGMNHHLLDQAPALVLKHITDESIAEVITGEQQVMEALRNFLER
jgi:hypothetical protein